MKRLGLTFALLALSCRDFNSSLQKCLDAGRCSDESSGGGAGGGSTSAGGGTAGGTSALGGGSSATGGGSDGGTGGSSDAGPCGVPGLLVCNLCLPPFKASTSSCSWPDGGSGPVTVRRSIRYLDQNGRETPVPDDLTGATLWVQVSSGWVNLSPSDAGTPGLLFFNAVPAGRRFVSLFDQTSQLGARLVESCESDIDVSEYGLGRPNDLVDESENITVTFNVSNLQPWQSSDILQFSSFSAGIGYSTFWPPDSPVLTTPLPTVGDTLGTISLNWGDWFAPNRLRLGDSFQLFQGTSAADDAGIVVRTASRSFKASDLLMTPDASIVEQVDMQSFASTRHLAVAVDRKAFLDAFARVPDGEGLVLDPVPPDGGHGLPATGSPDIVSTAFLYADGGSVPVGPEPIALNVDYGSPFPSDWSNLLIYALLAPHSARVPGTTVDGGPVATRPPPGGPAHDEMRLTITEPTLARLGTLKPLLATPTVMLNDETISIGQFVSDPNAIISLDSSASPCAPDHYRFIFVSLTFDPVNQVLIGHRRFVVETTQPSLSVPPAFLTAGYYTIQAMTLITPGRDALHPLLFSSDEMSTFSTSAAFCFTTDGGPCQQIVGGM